VDKQVRNKLQKYKRYADWVDIYNGNIQAGMGMSYEGISVKSNENTSDVENKVLKREENYEEYKEKLQYIDAVEAILDKLDDYERFIITKKFNLNDEDYLKQFKTGEVPNVEIYSHPRFHYSRREYFRIKKRALRKLKELLKLI